MAAHTTFLLLTLVSVTWGSGGKYPGCELLTRSTYCSEDVQHSFTPYSQYVRMPNIMGDESQEEAGSTVDLISGFVSSLGVSTHNDPNYRLFTCSMFLPPCMEDGSKVQPCRSLCEQAREAGRDLDQRGHRWPDEFRCDKFPDASDSRVMCIPPTGHAGGLGTGGDPGINPSGATTGGGDTWVDEEEEWVDEDEKEKANKGQGPVIKPSKGGEEEWVDEDEEAFEKVDKVPGPMVPASQCLDITREFSLNRCTCTCPP